MQYNRVSADCHLDMPWMPPELFTSEASQGLKERMPFVKDGPDGPVWVTKSGANFGLLNGVGPGGAKLVPGQNKRVDIMAQTGLFEDGKIGRPEARTAVQRPSNPHLRLKDMDRDGVDAEIIFGILGGASKMQDVEAANHMLFIYNTWLVEFCKHYPDRQIGLGCIPYGDVEAAVEEVYRCARMGLKGLELSCSWDMEPMWHPSWEPMWKAVSDVRLPLHFHTFPTTPPRAREVESVTARRAAMFTGVSAFQMGLIHILAAMMGAGVFERYPNLKVSFGESGIGWIPYALDRMDFEFEDRFRDLMKLKPSEYWQRQCKATFQYDVIGPKLLGVNNLMTVDTLMWGSDYPHTDGIWPESSIYIKDQFAGLSEADIKKITCDNAVEFYNLKN
jgi:predicted TIM-barrel fold metal-dependent hydrolase